MELTERSFDLSSRGLPYLVDVRASESQLSLCAEDLDSCQYWKGQYSSEYVESATRKTGSSRKFATFVKMLVSALEASSETVDFAILTYADVMRMRARQTCGRPQMTTGKESQTRYLIINYAGEFADKVHYPLPLAFEEAPDRSDLQRTIARLRKEVETLRKTAACDDNLLRENNDLKQKLARKTDSEAQMKKETEANCEAQQRDCLKEIRRLQSANEELKSTNLTLQNELSRLKTEMDTIIAQLEGEDDSQSIRSLQEQLQSSEARLAKTTKQVTQLQQENSSLLRQLETFAVSDRKQKLRISQIEAELETAMQAKVQTGKSRVRSRSPSTCSPATSRVNTSRERPESRSSVRSSSSEKGRKGPARNASPSRSFRGKSPSRDASRKSPQRVPPSPKRSFGAQKSSPSIRKREKQLASKPTLPTKDREDENSPNETCVSEINERLARLRRMMSDVKR